MVNSLNKTAASATLHCLTGCAVGEFIGMVITTLFSFSSAASVAISIILAFIFGYSFSMRPLLKHGLRLKEAMKIALAADTASIATMEAGDNIFVLAVPGAISAGLTTFLFWWSLLISLVVAFLVAFPINRWLISRGKGHALAHAH